MSPREIAWRMQTEIRDSIDRIRIPLGLVPGFRSDVNLTATNTSPGFRTTYVPLAAWTGNMADPLLSRWTVRLRNRADEIAENRLSFFNLKNVFVGDPIDWNRDHECGKPAPLGLSQKIDYRDYRVTGDAKMVWEPNRHHHLVVLGRAYRAFGEPRYAEAVYRHINSWIATNPFGYGMNWRSPLELGIRVINWVWALDLVREHGGGQRGLDGNIEESVWRHLWEITRKYSRGSSSNNHLIGEAAGVFIGSAYFQDLPSARKWRDESHEILSKEILRQTYETGCTREQAFGYHLFVLQFFILVGIVGRRVGLDFPPQCWERIKKMLEFAGAMAEGGPLTMFGDCDDGYVLDLAGGGNDAAELFSVGAVVFERTDLKALADEFGEAAYWLLDTDARKRWDDLPMKAEAAELHSLAYPDSGHYLLQSGHAHSEDRFSLFFDCAELGYTSIAAHGHADALSFTLRVGGRDVFVDPGTFDYFTYPECRSYYRSTSAHNTVEIDGQNQSEMLGPFLWGERAKSKCIRFETAGQGGIVSGEHDGYTRLADPVRHIRTIEMDGGGGAVSITDEIRAAGDHHIRIFFHIAEEWRTRQDGGSRIWIESDGPMLVLETDPSLQLTLVTATEDSQAGWVSRGYHMRGPGATIVATGKSNGDEKFRCVIRRSVPEV